MLDVADVADVSLLLQLVDRDAAILLLFAVGAIIFTLQRAEVFNVLESLKHPSTSAAILTVPVAVDQLLH